MFSFVIVGHSFFVLNFFMFIVVTLCYDFCTQLNEIEYFVIFGHVMSR
jgi:hypothetical protein